MELTAVPATQFSSVQSMSHLILATFSTTKENK